MCDSGASSSLTPLVSLVVYILLDLPASKQTLRPTTKYNQTAEIRDAPKTITKLPTSLTVPGGFSLGFGGRGRGHTLRETSDSRVIRQTSSLLTCGGGRFTRQAVVHTELAYSNLLHQRTIGHVQNHAARSPSQINGRFGRRRRRSLKNSMCFAVFFGKPRAV